MPTLLDVFASPRHERSRTRQLRDAFVEAWKSGHAEGQVVTVDLPTLDEGLPDFDEWDIEAKLQMLHGAGELSPELAQRWDKLTRFTDQLHLADVVVISSPMWNLSIPWTLKRWFDVVVQPRLTFEQRDGGFHGLLRGRKGVILVTRDGAYLGDSPFAKLDFQLPYLKQVLAFMGLDPIHVVVAEGLGYGAEAADRALAKARAEAQELGRKI